MSVSTHVKGVDFFDPQSFDYTVTLSDTGINGTYGDMEFVDGVASFTQEAANDYETKAVTATDLPSGITYTVKQTKAQHDNAQFQVDEETQTGKILTDESVSVEFVDTNTNIGTESVYFTPLGNNSEKMPMYKNVNFYFQLVSRLGSEVDMDLNATVYPGPYADGIYDEQDKPLRTEVIKMRAGEAIFSITPTEKIVIDLPKWWKFETKIAPQDSGRVSYGESGRGSTRYSYTGLPGMNAMYSLDTSNHQSFYSGFTYCVSNCTLTKVCTDDDYWDFSLVLKDDDGLCLDGWSLEGTSTGEHKFVNNEVQFNIRSGSSISSAKLPVGSKVVLTEIDEKVTSGNYTVGYEVYGGGSNGAYDGDDVEMPAPANSNIQILARNIKNAATTSTKKLAKSKANTDNSFTFVVPALEDAEDTSSTPETAQDQE